MQSRVLILNYDVANIGRIWTGTKLSGNIWFLRGLRVLQHFIACSPHCCIAPYYPDVHKDDACSQLNFNHPCLFSAGPSSHLLSSSSWRIWPWFGHRRPIVLPNLLHSTSSVNQSSPLSTLLRLWPLLNLFSSHGLGSTRGRMPVLRHSAGHSSFYWD